MELTFLGTSSGVPTKQRNVTGLAIRPRSGKNWVLVDCGEGTQHRLLLTPHSLNRLSAICITHVHGDHCYGLPGLLASMSMAKREEAIKLIAPQAIKTLLDCVIKTSDLHLNFPIDFIPVESLFAGKTGTTVALDDFTISSVELSHRVPCYAYVLEEFAPPRKLNVEYLKKIGLPQGPLWSQLLSEQSIQLEDGRTIRSEDALLPKTQPQKAIIGGDNDNPSCLETVVEGANLLVHEATYTAKVAEKVGPQTQHSCAPRVAKFAQQHGLKNLLLTHFSARYHERREEPESIAEIEKEAKRHYDGRLFLANDLDVYELAVNGILEKKESLK